VTDDRIEDLTSNASGANSAAAALGLQSWVVALLVCPFDFGAVRLEKTELICTRCGRRYPVLSGIPIMLADHATVEQKF
jgi:uncharacterized protein YbaR (Trm112 family)